MMYGNGQMIKKFNKFNHSLHIMREKVEIAVPAISQAEAKQLVNKWLQGQRT